jgi:hypothetical protein
VARTAVSGPGAARLRLTVASSRSLSAGKSADVSGGHRFTPDPPVGAFHFFDWAKGNLAHVLALDRDHRVGEMMI